MNLAYHSEDIVYAILIVSFFFWFIIIIWSIRRPPIAFLLDYSTP